MFALRGAAVSLSVLVMVYCGLSFAVACAWRRFCAGIRPGHAQGRADLLFILRILPLAAAMLITAAFTVPSFLMLEPRAIDEPMGALPLVLGLFATALAGFGIINAATAARKASRTISSWKREAQLRPYDSRVPVLRIAQPIPAMTTVGMIRPRILLSGAAESVLGSSELDAALRHEAAHVRRHDNLKKLLFHVVAFPGMRGLEAAWLESSEIAADEAAVSNSAEALDLAAALIKLSRFAPTGEPEHLTAALVHSPASAMSTRVYRLISWSDGRQLRSGNAFGWRIMTGGLAAAVVLAAIYSPTLARVHAATEWLIR